ncbi:MAG: outer membrane beta-barrel protein [Flavipsychrobacter sp.]|nr:outer membrane beta-barrel protein [Flavipsychrobacter sp.]
MKLKYISLLLLALSARFLAQGQIKYIPPTAHAFSIGIGAGITELYGDFYGKPKEPSFWGDVNYNITPYFCAGIQGQYGNLTTGGLDVTKKADGFYIKNAYSTVNANVRLSLGAFFTHATPTTFLVILSGVYGGAGYGIIHNDITTSTRGGLNQESIMHGVIKSSSFVGNVPLNVGIDVTLPRIIGITGLVANANYQYNICQSDYVDGYDPNIQFNKHNDTYTYISVGLRYNFGRIR